MGLRLRILCIFGYSPSTVQFRARILPLFQRLVRREHTSTILTADRNLPVVTLDEKADIDEATFKRQSPSPSYSGLFLRAKGEVSKRYDVLCTIKADLPSFFASFPLARIHRIPLVVDVDDYETSPSPFRAALKAKAMKFLLRKCEHLVVASKELYNLARAIRSGPVTYIPNSTDLEQFDPHLYRTRASNGNTTLVWSGILYPFARWKFLLKALAYTTSDFNMLIMGGGPSEDEFIYAAKKLGVWDRITMTGCVPHTEVPALLGKADAALLPLINNIYDRCKCPIKLFEYMAMELPVICTDVGEPAYTVQEAGCGLVAPPDPKGFAEIMDYVVEDIDYWRKRARRGRKYLKRFQNWNLLSLRLESALRSAYKDYHERESNQGCFTSLWRGSGLDENNSKKG